MSAPEPASQNSNFNYTKNEKREDASTDINKNGDVYKRLYTQHLFNNISDSTNVSTSVDEKDVDDDVLEELRCVFAEKRRYAVLCIRVLPRVKLIWDSLKADVKKLLRDVFERIVQEYSKQSRISVESRSVVVNVNINQQVVNVDRKDENIVKLKKELDRLRDELARATAENVELKNELEKMRKRCDELQRQLQSTSHVHGSGSALNSAVFDLAVIAECLEAECNKQKLLNFVKREYEKLSKYVSTPRQELVSAIVKMLQQ